MKRPPSTFALLTWWLFTWLPLDLLAAPAGSMSVPAPAPPASPSSSGLGRESESTLDSFLRTDIPPADGFDFPIGDPDGWGEFLDPRDGKTRTGYSVFIRFGQWYSYGIHPGEDWNGAGSGNSDEGQPVHAVAAGRVVFAEPDVRPAGGIVIIQHVFYENHLKRRIRSVYKHLTDLRVEPGQLVERRQLIGAIGRGSDRRYLAHLHFELRWDESLGPTFWPSARRKSLEWIHEHYAPPSAFIRGHRQLFVPQHEDHLVLIDADRLRLAVFQRGEKLDELAIGWGRPSGDRVRAAFDRPQRGMYFVVERQRGLVGGDFGTRRDGFRLKLNYPNPFDAARGRRLGLVLPHHEARIASAWRNRRPTPDDSLLKRGLAFTGWLTEWDPAAERSLGWGRLLLPASDFQRVFDRAPLGTMVIIF